jgi:replicative DNA helicase
MNNLNELNDKSSSEDLTLSDKILHHAQIQLPEHELLYALITNADARQEILTELSAEHFLNTDISFCVKIIIEAVKSDIPLDAHQVHADLYQSIRNIDFSDTVGEYWQGSIHTVKEQYKRHLIRESNMNAQQICMNPHYKPEHKTALLMQEWETVRDKVNDKTDKTTKEKLLMTVDYLQGCLKGDIQFCEWGINGLDKYMKLRPHCCYFVGALPATGKTSFAISAIINQCIAGKRVFFWCGEMTEEQIYTRIISQLTHRPLDILENRNESSSATSGLLADIHHAMKTISKWDLVTLCGEDMTFEQIATVVRRYHKKKPLDCAWFDYYSDIQPRPELAGNPKHEQMSDITKQVKTLKKEIDVPLVMLAQLKRDAVDRYPRKTDIAESSTCEQVADGIVLLDRPIKGRDVNERNYWINGFKVTLDDLFGKCALVIGKNRFGAECVSVYEFDAPLMKFGSESQRYNNSAMLETAEHPNARKDING